MMDRRGMRGLSAYVGSLKIMILEHLHFCLVNHACVSHLLRGQPHLLECYYRNCLIGTHGCVHPVSE